MLRNTTQSFGSVTKLLHWFIFILLSMQFILIWIRNAIPKDAPERATYMLVHRSVGMLLLVLGLFYIAWRLISIKPKLLDSSNWTRIAVRMMHHFLLYFMVIMAVDGYCISSAAGKEISFFGLFTLPNLVPQNKNIVDVCLVIHEQIGNLILVLVGLHIFAAFVHHFMFKDNVLRRMLP